MLIFIRYRVPFFLLLLFSLTSCGGGSGSTTSVQDTNFQASGLEVSIETEDGLNIGVIRGETSTHRVLLFKDDTNISTKINLVTENRWIELIESDGETLLSIDATQHWDDIIAPVTVIVTNLDNGLTTQTDLLVSLLDTTLVASGTLNSGGGVIASNGGASAYVYPRDS